MATRKPSHKRSTRLPPLSLAPDPQPEKRSPKATPAAKPPAKPRIGRVIFF